jgi:hypothetical protein
MISLDQVLLLEEKVESAVAKIAQLNAENAALRSKCAELTNALSAKTEQFSNFQSDQGKIEAGILKALERLDSVENAIHQAGSTAANPGPVNQAPQAASPAPQQSAPVQQAAPAAPVQEKPVQPPVNTFDTMNPAPSAPASQESTPDSSQPTFDIF